MLTAAVLDALNFDVATNYGLRDEAGVLVVFCDASGDGKIAGPTLAIESAANIKAYVVAQGRAWLSECQGGSLLFAVRYISDQSQREAFAQMLRRLNQD